MEPSLRRQGSGTVMEAARVRGWQQKEYAMEEQAAAAEPAVPDEPTPTLQPDGTVFPPVTPDPPAPPGYVDPLVGLELEPEPDGEGV